MTAAEYRALREAGGLSVREAGALHRVPARLILYWESQENGIPPYAAEQLEQMDAQIEDAVLNAVDLYLSQRELNGTPDAVALIRYRTAKSYVRSLAAQKGFLYGCHNALITHTMEALKQVGARVSLLWR